MTKKMKEKFTVQVVKKKKRKDGTVAVSVPQVLCPYMYCFCSIPSNTFQGQALVMSYEIRKSTRKRMEKPLPDFICNRRRTLIRTAMRNLYSLYILAN